MLESLITSKTRLRLLVKFFVNVANQGYLRGLADEFNESTNAIRKELNNLTDAGYLHKVTIGNKIQYQADPSHPLFTLLQKIMKQYVGLDALVSLVLERMGNVERIVIIGDYANGIDSGIIEVVLVGELLNVNYIEKLSVKIEKKIGRKVLFYIKRELDDKGLVIYEFSEITDHQNLN